MLQCYNLIIHGEREHSNSDKVISYSIIWILKIDNINKIQSSLNGK